MTMFTSLADVCELARRMKREVVACHGTDTDEERSDLPSFVAVVRRGRPVALVYTGPGPDGGRLATYWAAALMRPEEIFTVLDCRSRTASSLEGLGSVQKGKLDRDWRAGRRSGLVECLWVQRYPVMGPPSYVMYPYERAGRRLTWLEPWDGDDDDHTAGAIPEHARQGYNDGRANLARIVPDLQVEADRIGVPDDERELFFDWALARLCSEQTGPVVLFGLELSSGGRPVEIATFVNGVELAGAGSRQN